MDTQFEAAQSHAPAPMPRPRAAYQAIHALIAGRLAWLGRFPIARWAPIPLRLIVGYGFMEHGFAKLARGPDAFPAILQALGVPAPHLMGWLTILVEIVGGLFVLLGALVPLASIPMAAVLLVAMITVHLPYGFSSIKLQAVTAAGAQFGPPGFETNLLYLACLAALVLGGPGPLAVGDLLARRRIIARSSSDAEPSAGCRAAAGPDGATAPVDARANGRRVT
jgi:putative oxidoreductase